MASKFRAKGSRGIKKRHIALIVLIIMLVISIQGFLFVEKNLEPALKEIARTYVNQLAMLAINDAISKKISEDMNHTDVLDIREDAEGNITLISYNTSNKAKVLTQVIERANYELIELSKEPIHIPIGQALDSNILAQLGPDVPITLTPMGAARADIEVRLEEAGINTVMVIAILKIEADVRIVIPFASDEAVIVTEYPISWDVIPGKVPDFYFKGGDGGDQGSGTAPPFSVPIEIPNP